MESRPSPGASLGTGDPHRTWGRLVWPALLGVWLVVAAPAYASPGDPFLPLLFKQLSDWTPAPTVTPSATTTPTRTATLTVTPTVTPTATPAVATLRIMPADQVVLRAGGAFSVSVEIENVSDLGAFRFGLAYDQSVVEATDVIPGPFLGSSGNTVLPFGPAIGQGWVTFAALAQGTYAGPQGAGTLAFVVFAPVAVGRSALHLQNVKLDDTLGGAIVADTVDGAVTVVAAGASAMALPALTLDRLSTHADRREDHASPYLSCSNERAP